MSETVPCVFIASSVWEVNGYILIAAQNRGAHVKNEKDPVELRPPVSDRVLVILCVDKSKGCISFTLFGDLPLNIRHSPTIGSIASSLRGAE